MLFLSREDLFGGQNQHEIGLATGGVLWWDKEGLVES
jgi:hypothetical protein